ncbi:hypothetical protein QQA02_10140 [Corynebacterium sp. MSK006]|uniref:hypothetical protein n=1 Tax=Corynebacterium sp. MSK006 TaxID=3050187 RepID=UPI00254F7CE8|nr:hypothetical protein [Corynebacterium sp. MSK006]MDK8896041.1 hypothetical protein [Corynebacterium sp. MSK006]
MEKLTSPPHTLDLDTEYARVLAADLAAGARATRPLPQVLPATPVYAVYRRALEQAVNTLGEAGERLAERAGRLAADSLRAVEAIETDDAALGAALPHDRLGAGGGEAR